jgi:hypothetical protein
MIGSNSIYSIMQYVTIYIGGIHMSYTISTLPIEILSFKIISISQIAHSHYRISSLNASPGLMLLPL